MRLYTTPTGKWAGTQADAKKLGAYMEYDVPTNKSGLMDFLNRHGVNEYTVRGYSEPLEENPQPAVKSIATHRESAWHNINRVAEEAPLSELTTAMNIIMHRIQEHLEEGVR